MEYLDLALLSPKYLFVFSNNSFALYSTSPTHYIFASLGPLVSLIERRLCLQPRCPTTGTRLLAPLVYISQNLLMLIFLTPALHDGSPPTLSPTKGLLDIGVWK